MSTKLNAEELANKRYPQPSAIMLDGTKVNHWAAGYATAIREVAQSIADQRDDYRKFVEEVAQWAEDCASKGIKTWHLDAARAILAKYPRTNDPA